MLVKPKEQEWTGVGHTPRLTVKTANGLWGQFRYTRDPLKFKIERSRVIGRANRRESYVEPVP